MATEGSDARGGEEQVQVLRVYHNVRSIAVEQGRLSDSIPNIISVKRAGGCVLIVARSAYFLVVFQAVPAEFVFAFKTCFRHGWEGGQPL